ncbi:2940_t:CDS:1, partial [Ambispora leptoticha]
PQQATARDKLSKLVKISSTPLLDLIVQRTRGWLVGSYNKPQSSTRRDPSAFELNETNIN